MNQPYVLGGLAVLFYAGCMLLNPWSNRFRRGWQFTREWPLTWLVLGIAGAHQGWWLERKEKLLFGWPEDFTPAFASELAGKAALGAGNSTAGSLIMPIMAEPLSVVLALAMFLNVGDIGLALRRGCVTAFPKSGRSVFAVLGVSAAANIGWLACLIGGWLPEQGGGIQALHAAGVLWSGASVAFALGWLIRLAETHFHAPEEILQIAWPGSAAGRIPRLWPVVLVAAAAHLWHAYSLNAAPGAVWTARVIGWLTALSLAFLPLLLVHWRGEFTWRAAFKEARYRLFCHFPELLAWCALALTHFFLFHLAHEGIGSGLPSGSVWKLGWDSLCSLLHAALTVWLLASWIAHQPKFQIPKTNFAQPPNPDT